MSTVKGAGMKQDEMSDVAARQHGNLVSPCSISSDKDFQSPPFGLHLIGKRLCEIRDKGHIA